MTDIAGLHAQALEATGRIVRAVPAGRWHAATPCAGWDALDPGLMEACQQIIEPQLDAFRGAGALGPEVAVPTGASAQTRFLALLGRTG